MTDTDFVAAYPAIAPKAVVQGDGMTKAVFSAACLHRFRVCHDRKQAAGLMAAFSTVFLAVNSVQSIAASRLTPVFAGQLRPQTQDMACGMLRSTLLQGLPQKSQTNIHRNESRSD